LTIITKPSLPDAQEVFSLVSFPRKIRTATLDYLGHLNGEGHKQMNLKFEFKDPEQNLIFKNCHYPYS